MKKIFAIIFALISISAFAHKEKWDDIKDGWSPLMLAIYYSKSDEVQQLLEKKVDVNYISKSRSSNWELTALDVAIRKEDYACAKKLLSTKKISHPEKFLMTASGQNNPQVVELLIQYGANPNEILENGYSVSIMATNFGSNEVLETLLKNGANPNHANSSGMTVLMFATLSGELEKVKLLLKYGAKKYTKDSEGKMAFDYVEKIRPSKKASTATISELKILLK